MNSENASATVSEVAVGAAEDIDLRETETDEVEIEELVEEISIDGMCGVY